MCFFSFLFRGFPILADFLAPAPFGGPTFLRFLVANPRACFFSPPIAIFLVWRRSWRMSILNFAKPAPALFVFFTVCDFLVLSHGWPCQCPLAQFFFFFPPIRNGSGDWRLQPPPPYCLDRFFPFPLILFFFNFFFFDESLTLVVETGTSPPECSDRIVSRSMHLCLAPFSFVCK